MNSVVSQMSKINDVEEMTLSMKQPVGLVHSFIDRITWSKIIALSQSLSVKTTQIYDIYMYVSKKWPADQKYHIQERICNE